MSVLRVISALAACVLLAHLVVLMFEVASACCAARRRAQRRRSGSWLIFGLAIALLTASAA